MAPTNATYQDIEGSQSLLTLTMEERVLELEKNMIKKPSMLVKVLCALAVAATVGIAYTTGHSVGHGAATNFASDENEGYGFGRMVMARNNKVPWVPPVRTPEYEAYGREKVAGFCQGGQPKCDPFVGQQFLQS